MINSLHTTICQDQKGSLFIGLIITMLLIVSLGAAMFAMTVTSSFTRVWVGSTSKAYYLAESGFRYAETEYKNADDNDNDGEVKDDQNDLLDGWHSKIFTFSTKKDKFELKIYSYYLITTQSHSKSEITLLTKFPGEQPANFSTPLAQPPPAKLKIGSDSPYTISSYSYDSNTKIHTFGLTPPLLSNVSESMNVHFIANPSAGSTITKGGNLVLADASLFPDRDGIFSIDNNDPLYNKIIYAYKIKNGNELQTIFNAKDPDGTFNDVNVLPSTNIVINPFVKLHSIGIVDHGSSMETKREIGFSVPLHSKIEEKEEYHETFEDKSKWEDSALGSHEVQPIDGGKALRVTSTESFGGSPKASLIGLDWSKTNVDLAAAHRYGNRFFLDYDAQVKIGYATTSSPPYGGYLPIPIPNYFAAGLSFRLDENLNSYGLSFLRGSSSGGPDNINNRLVPLDDTLLIVLWQKAGPNDSDSNWLAYKDISTPALFFDNFERGQGKWTKEAPWDRTKIDSYRGNWCWTDSASGNYANNMDISLTSKAIDLSDESSALLSFWHRYDVQPWNESLGIGDRAFVEISKDGGIIWTVLPPSPYSGDQGEWIQEPIYISDYAGESNVKIRFRLITDGTDTDLHDGWYIDDVTVSGSNFPLNESTLLVRIKESASISFDNGGTSEIIDRDILVGATNSASGTVNGTPIIASGSWPGGDAAGTILLKNVSGTFSDGEQLTVNGTSVSATVRTPILSRTNYIRAYYGNPSDYGTPNIDPLDFEKHGNPRDPANVNWPPDEVEDWSADNDYFTLIQWDGLNTAIVSSVASIESLDEPDAIIRSTEPVLFTPFSGIFDRTELGLHTFGHGSLNVYFDDFALQTKVISISGFLPAIQE